MKTKLEIAEEKISALVELLTDDQLDEAIPILDAIDTQMPLFLPTQEELHVMRNIDKRLKTIWNFCWDRGVRTEIIAARTRAALGEWENPDTSWMEDEDEDQS